jgi:hypothetical protein
VNWYDAIRFANWLLNGQGDGDTETGAYTFGQLNPDGIPVNGNTPPRQRSRTPPRCARSPSAASPAVCRWWLAKGAKRPTENCPRS